AWGECAICALEDGRLLVCGRNVSGRRLAEEARTRAHRALAALNEVQATFIADADAKGAFARLLAALLEATESRAGALAEAHAASEELRLVASVHVPEIDHMLAELAQTLREPAFDPSAPRRSLCVPLRRADGRLAGAVFLFDREGGYDAPLV